MFGYVDEFTEGIIKDGKIFKIVWNGTSIWACNYIKIREYSKDKVVLKIKNNSIVIEGVDIYIKMLNKNEIVLSGKFNSIYAEKPYVLEENNNGNV